MQHARQLEAPSRGGAGSREQLLAGVLPDAALVRALGACTAAEVACRIVPLGPLPAGPVRALYNASQVGTAWTLKAQQRGHQDAVDPSLHR